MNLPKKLLLACTTKSSFLHIDNSLYLQADDVSMDFRLGVTLANFYMVNVENNILDNNPHLKPSLYCRYVDDIFIVVDSLEQLMLLKQTFNNSSVLQ